MSGRFIGGSGNDTSSKAIVSFMPGRSKEGSGSLSRGFSSASRMASSGSARGASASGGYTMRLPTGRRSNRKPSPCQNSVGGVERSTSRTKPGLGMRRLPPPLRTEVEGHLHRASAAGVGRVLDGILPAVERVQGGHEALQTSVLNKLEGTGEVVLGVGVSAA